MDESTQAPDDTHLEQMYGVPEHVEQGKTPWSIRNDSDANYAMRRIARFERAKAKRAAEVARWQLWQAQEDARDQHGIAFFTGHLSRYADRLRVEGVINHRRKSYNLPSGVLSFREKAATFLRNTAELLPWAKHEGLVRTTEDVDWEALKDRLVVQVEEGPIVPRYLVIDQQTGEQIPGISVSSPTHDEFRAKPSRTKGTDDD